MTLSPPDSPEFVLYDKDLKTKLAFLHGYQSQIYLRYDDCGSGLLTLPINDETASIVTQFVPANIDCPYIEFSYRGAVRGGFYVEQVDFEVINTEEYSGMVMNLSGRGALSMLDDAIVWDWGTPGTDNVRYFGENGIEGSPVSRGYMLYTLLDEARNKQTNPYGQTLERYCWRVGVVEAGAILFDWDFDDTDDSASVGWDDESNMEFRVGMSLLDIARQFTLAGYDFTTTHDATNGKFILHAYNDRIGTDRSTSVIFRAGQNCRASSLKYDGGSIVNAGLVEYSNDTVPYTYVHRNFASHNQRRKEGLITAGTASDEDTAIDLATATLYKSDVKCDISISVNDAVWPKIFTDYNVGDWIGFDYGDGTVRKHLILGAQLAWDEDQKDANVILELVLEGTA